MLRLMTAERANDRRASLWRHTEFLKLWGATSVSHIGSMFGALSLTALLTLDASPAQMSLLAVCATLPVLLFSLAAGVWIDRLPRRPLLIVSDLGRFALLATVPTAALLDALTMGQVYGVAFGVSLLEVVFNLSYRSLLPGLVGRDELVEANSKLGGAIVQVASSPFAVLLDALTFLVSGLLLTSIKRAPEQTDREARRPLRQEALEGLMTVVRHPVLRAFALTSATVYAFGGFFVALYPVWVVQELGLSPIALGVLIGAGGVGSIAGAALVGPMSRRYGVGPAMTGARLTSGLLGLLTPLAGGPRELAFALLFAHQLLGDGFWVIYDVNALSLRQAVTPDRQLGRVNAAFLLLGEGWLPVGAIAAGIIATAFGVQAAMFVAATGMAFAVVWLLLSPARSMRTVPRVVEVEP